jgi:hypothetical protein
VNRARKEERGRRRRGRVFGRYTLSAFPASRLHCRGRRRRRRRRRRMLVMVLTEGASRNACSTQSGMLPTHTHTDTCTAYNIYVLLQTYYKQHNNGYAIANVNATYHITAHHITSHHIT